jgi:hypothetical protein
MTKINHKNQCKNHGSIVVTIVLTWGWQIDYWNLIVTKHEDAKTNANTTHELHKQKQAKLTQIGLGINKTKHKNMKMNTQT